MKKSLIYMERRPKRDRIAFYEYLAALLGLLVMTVNFVFSSSIRGSSLLSIKAKGI